MTNAYAPRTSQGNSDPSTTQDKERGLWEESQAEKAHDQDVVRLRHHFTGSVQSRGFRYSCVKASGKAHVTGWAENQTDGSVIAETQGNPHQQEAFLKRLSVIMPGFGSAWFDRCSEIPVIQEEESFCAHR